MRVMSYRACDPLTKNNPIFVLHSIQIVIFHQKCLEMIKTMCLCHGLCLGFFKDFFSKNNSEVSVRDVFLSVRDAQ